MERARATQIQIELSFEEKEGNCAAALDFRLESPKNPERLTPDLFEAEILMQARKIASAYRAFHESNVPEKFDAWLKKTRDLIRDAARDGALV